MESGLQSKNPGIQPAAWLAVHNGGAACRHDDIAGARSHGREVYGRRAGLGHRAIFHSPPASRCRDRAFGRDRRANPLERAGDDRLSDTGQAFRAVDTRPAVHLPPRTVAMPRRSIPSHGSERQAVELGEHGTQPLGESLGLLSVLGEPFARVSGVAFGGSL